MLLLFFLLFPLIASTSKMMVMWGTVEEYDSSENAVGDFTACINLCNNDGKCLLISYSDESGCLIYRYGNISSLRVSEERMDTRIGLKRTLDTCPASIFNDGFETETYQTRLIGYQYTMNITNNIWTFDYKYLIQCQNDSFVSIRGDNQVCISVRAFSNVLCQSQTFGQKLCNDAIGLTGPYSRSEGEIIADYMEQKRKEVAMSASIIFYNFWIDGTKTVSDYVVTDKTLIVNGTLVYNFVTDPKVSSHRCAFLGKIEVAEVYADECEREFAGNWCLRGAICRTNPVATL